MKVNDEKIMDEINNKNKYNIVVVEVDEVK